MPGVESIVNQITGCEPIVVGDREISATRIFDAPRALIWRAFTDADHLKHWWGPNGFTNTFHAFDLKVGGLWRFTMHGPDGRNYENESRFVEIDWLNKIILDHICEPHFRLTVQLEDYELRRRSSRGTCASKALKCLKPSSPLRCRASRRISIVSVRICR